jgi:hypothetical protein
VRAIWNGSALGAGASIASDGVAADATTGATAGAGARGPADATGNSGPAGGRSHPALTVAASNAGSTGSLLRGEGSSASTILPTASTFARTQVAFAPSLDRSRHRAYSRGVSDDRSSTFSLHWAQSK